MPHWGETIRLRQFVLEPFDLLIIYLGKFPAFQADEVVMVFTVIFRFVACLFVPDFNLIRQAALTQQTNIAVDSRVTYLRMVNLYYAKQFFNSNMFFHRKESIENDISLSCIAQSLLA